MRHALLALTLILFLSLPAAASAAKSSACPHSDCPLWARSANYATPTSTQTSSHKNIWYDDTDKPQRTRYVFHEIHHQPRIWYVHRNDNFYRTNAGTSSRTRHRTHSSYSYSGPVYDGGHFTRYY